MARLAWFTPLPPDRSGIATYSAEILPVLASSHEIDVFLETALEERRRPSAVGGAGERGALDAPHRRDATASAEARHGARPQRLLPAHDFVWRHTLRPYDLIVYHLGNATCHDYMWAYFPRYPGLVVLHDAQLHHARARQLLAAGRERDYEAELRFSHPSAPEGLAHLFRSGLGGTLYYFWPLLAVAVESAKVVAVHSPWLALELARMFPRARVEQVSMGTADPDGDRHAETASRAAALRRSLGIPEDTVVFAAFGRVTPEKRIPAALRALREVRAYVPDARLMLVGEPAGYYDVKSEAESLHVSEAVTVTGYVPDADLPFYVAASDVCLCLRWPSGRETSASWLRCLAAGKPTIITELAHGASVPALDPRTWAPMFTADESERGRSLSEPSPPLAVAIDILDEDHSLGLAMRRLAADRALRASLGNEARRYWERGHTLARMAADYEKVIASALDTETRRDRQLPAHLLADGTRTAIETAASVGVDLVFLGGTVPDVQANRHAG
ncbi:MAG: glycosyltransferase family 4 protein [Vicinamibacterales bacterium]